MLIRFFKTREFPPQAAVMLLHDFRDFRLGLDLDTPVVSFDPPDDAPKEGNHP